MKKRMLSFLLAALMLAQLALPAGAEAYAEEQQTQAVLEEAPQGSAEEEKEEAEQADEPEEPEEETPEEPVEEPQDEEDGEEAFESEELPADNTCGENLTWTLNEDGTLVISGTGDMTDYALYTGEDREVCSTAPWFGLPVKSLLLSDNLTRIGDCAFYDCKELTGTLTLPKKLTSIGVSAFEGCKGITGELVIPDGVTEISSDAFLNTVSLTGAVLPKGLTTVAPRTFGWSAITYVKIPASVTKIEDRAFMGASLLGTVYYGSTREDWYNIDIGEYNEYLTGAQLMVPACVSYNPGLGTGEPETQAAGEDGKVRLSWITPTLDGYIFKGWTDRYDGVVGKYQPGEEITISEDLALYAVWESNRVERSGQCGDNMIWELDDNCILNISGTGAMWDYNSDGGPWAEYQIDGILFNGEIFYIGENAFRGRSYDFDIVVPDSVMEIGKGAFMNSVFGGKLYLSNGMSYIPENAFCYSTLQYLVIPESITVVESGAFRGAQIGSLEYGGSCVLWNNMRVEDGNDPLLAVHPSFGDDAEEITGIFGEGLTWSLDESGTLTISGSGPMPDLSEEGMEKPWFGFSIRKLVVEEGITRIGTYSFSLCDKLESVELPQSLTSIGAYAFCGCSELAGELVLPDRLESIGTYAFSSCASLTGDLVLPDSVREVGMCAFSWCPNLTGKLTLSEGLTELPGYGFYMSSFSSLVIPSSVKKIGAGCFEDCANLTEVLYLGSSEDWEGVEVDVNNAPLDNVTCGTAFYTVVYAPNGGEGDMKASVIAVGSTGTLRENAFRRPGYHFLGWSRTAGGKVQFTDGQEVANLSTEAGTEVTLYALWAVNTYTARFLPGAEGTKGTVKDLTKLTAGKAYTAPRGAYTRPGYVFAGWQLGEETYAAGKKFTVTEAEDQEIVEFTAQWTPITYKVRFNANKGVGKMADQTGLVYGEATALNRSTLNREHYEFVGWNTKANGTGVAYADKGEVRDLTTTNNGTVTLYAQWEGDPYTVVFHNGEETQEQELHYGTAEALEKNGFEKTGYTFKSWTTLENGKGKSYKDGAKVTNLGGGARVTHLYAQWTPNKYTVVFHSNADKDTTKKQTLTFDGKQTALSANSFSWKGHTFLGWSEQKDGEVDFTNKQFVTNLTDQKTIDLYAVWKTHGYTVAFEGNGADSGEMDSLGMTYGKAAELPQNAFRREGYTFTGWAVSAKGAAKYGDGAEVTSLTDKDGATVRLYATWFKGYVVNFAPGAEGVTGSMKPMKLVPGKTYTLTGVTFKRPGYVFTGWAVEGSDTVYGNRAKVQDLAQTGTVTLTAQWKLK